ncbi:MAG: sigma-54-dependent Fis family transcriptional regulator [Deltaproteobacteria bacterium]|nr:sigma-54-dependent Fis family transcriptional regulator [Deltaproteobacteria bacterium]
MGKILAVGFREQPDKKVLGFLAKEGWEVHQLSPSDMTLARPLPLVDLTLFFFGREGYEGALQLLKKFQSSGLEMPVICLSRQMSVDQVVETMKNGAFDYFQSPPDFEKLLVSLNHASQNAQLKRKLRVLESQVGWEGKFDDIVGVSSQMQEIFQMVQTVAKSNATVLIMGESGTGKELVARAIHRHSERFKNKFIDLNCGAIPKELLENELFGHERGSYTGADKQYIGSCERAHGGTLFLDEVSEMDASLQVKLLRVLQERKFCRIGGSELVEVDIRIIAATNKDLRQEVEKGGFREDLYYRLNVVPITLPPLRRRRDDIPVLAQHFLEKYSKENRKNFKGFAPEAMTSFVNYDWPGNVRELENNIERIVVLQNEARVKPNHLPRFILNVGAKGEERASAWDADGYQKVLPLRLVEQYAIEGALERCRGDVVAAAKKLGIGQATMYRKVKRFGIKVP